MAKAKLGARSLERLHTCDPDLVRVFLRVEQICPFDFTILGGIRTDEEQIALYAQGRTAPGRIVTKVDGVKIRSRHQANKMGLSEALDAVPFPVDWKNTKQMLVFIGVVFAAAEIEGVRIRTGVDWDGDWNLDEHSFMDYPHFELA